MAESNKIGGMEANIGTLLKAITAMDERSEARDKASQEFREKVVGSLATINEKLETANQSQIKNMEYQAACDAERRVIMARVVVLETTQDEHGKDIASHVTRITAVETEQAHHKGAIQFAVWVASVIGGCLGFIATFIAGTHK